MKPFILIIALSFSLLYTACSFCNRVECGDSVQLSFLVTRDGKNAVFGPDAFLSPDDIRLFTEGMIPGGVPLPLQDSTGTHEVSITPGILYIILIESMPTDSFEISTSPLEKGECCWTHRLSRLELNGETVCMDDCDEVIEIKI